MRSPGRSSTFDGTFDNVDEDWKTGRDLESVDRNPDPLIDANLHRPLAIQISTQNSVIARQERIQQRLESDQMMSSQPSIYARSASPRGVSVQPSSNAIADVVVIRDSEVKMGEFGKPPLDIVDLKNWSTYSHPAVVPFAPEKTDLDRRYDAFVLQPDHLFGSPERDLVDLELEIKIRDFRQKFRLPEPSQEIENLKQPGSKEDIDRVSKDFVDLIYTMTGVKLKMMGAEIRLQGERYPVVTHVRACSSGTASFVQRDYELRSIDVIRESLFQKAIGFDVLGISMEGICLLLSGDHPLTASAAAIENTSDFERSHLQMRFVEPTTGKMVQMPVNARSVKERLLKDRTSEKAYMNSAVTCLGISASDIEKNILALFNQMDTNGGGSIDPEELRVGLQRIDCHISAEESQNLFNEIDEDGGGEIEFDEFKIAILRVCGGTMDSWEIVRHGIRTWMKASCHHRDVDSLWPYAILSLALHLVMTLTLVCLVITWGKASYVQDAVPVVTYDGKPVDKDNGNVEWSRHYKTVAMIVVGVVALIFEATGIRLDNDRFIFSRSGWLALGGMAQMIGSSLLCASGLSVVDINAALQESAREDESHKTAQRIISVLTMVTGSLNASFCFTLAIRLWLGQWMHDSVATQMSKQILVAYMEQPLRISRRRAEAAALKELQMYQNELAERKRHEERELAERLKEELKEADNAAKAEEERRRMAVEADAAARRKKLQEDAAAARAQVLAKRRREEQEEHAAAEAAVKAAEAAERAKREAEEAAWAEALHRGRELRLQRTAATLHPLHKV